MVLVAMAVHLEPCKLLHTGKAGPWRLRMVSYTKHDSIIHFSLNCFRILAVLFLKQDFPSSGLLEINRFPEVNNFGAVSNELVQIERRRVQVKIFHYPVMVHKRWIFLGDWKIREAHHLFAGVDHSWSVHRAVPFFLSKIPQSTDRVFLLETHRLQSFV